MRRTGCAKALWSEEVWAQRMFEEEENVHSIWSTAGKREHAGEDAGEADGARLSRGL